jgi:MYXO-CTERM domain-containing protein
MNRLTLQAISLTARAFACGIGAALLLAGQIASAQNEITTAAGNGNPDNKGANAALPGPSAELTAPAGLAVDQSGNLYVADGANYIVRKLDTNGVMTTIAGSTEPVPETGADGDGGPALDATFSYVESVEFGPDGRLYIADDDANVIRAIDLGTGIITRVAGNAVDNDGDGQWDDGFDGDGQNALDASVRLARPSDIAFDSAGNMYIADFINNRIRRVDVGGVITTFAGSGTFGSGGVPGPATSIEMKRPVGLAVDGNDNVYIADGANNRILRVDAVTSNVTIYAGTGTSGFSGDGDPAVDATIAGPRGLQFDAAGNLYFGDSRNNRVRMVDTNGDISTIAGSAGPDGFGGDYGPPTDADLFRPWDVALAPNGDIFISDNQNHRIRKIAPPTANNLPTDIQLSQTTVVTQDSGSSQDFARVEVTDPDPGEGDNAYVTLAPGAGDENNLDFTIFVNQSRIRLRNPATAMPGEYFIRVQADDRNGGVFQKALTVTVEDGIAPEITLVDEGQNPQQISAGTPYTELGATALDNVDGDISASIVIDASEVNTAVAGDYSVTYDVMDAAGNAAVTVTRTVSVGADVTPPVITLLGANPQTIGVGGAYTELGATATDDVDGDVSANIVIDASAVDTDTPGNYSVTYDVMDNAGNAAATMTRTVTVAVGADSTPPVITLVGANPQTITVGSAYTELGATATDDVDGDVTADIVIDASAVDTSAAGNYSVTYNVTDAAGNAAATVTRTVTVRAVTTPPPPPPPVSTSSGGGSVGLFGLLMMGGLLLVRRRRQLGA